MTTVDFTERKRSRKQHPATSSAVQPTVAQSTLRPFHDGNPSPQRYLSVVCIFKDEGRHLDEWLAFCVAQGVDHFLLYDNGSSDNSREILRPWIASGIVEVIDWPVPWKSGAQVKAYADALSRLRGRTKWAAFIDVDEFLFSPAHATLDQALRAYHGRAGVVVNWQCYGSSGHRDSPAGLTIESFTRRARTCWARNERVKTIVDPWLATRPRGPHLFDVLPGQSLVTEDFRPVRVVRDMPWRRALRYLTAWFPYLPVDPYGRLRPSTRQVSVSQLRINHYVTRSLSERPLKYKDRHTMADRDRNLHWRYHDRNEVEDPVLAPQAARVRQIILWVRSGLSGLAPATRAVARRP